MTGFGGLLLALAALLVAHAARRGLRFSLTWWSFTFPVGTCVTGASGLAAATGAVAVEALALALFALLLAAWAVVATGTARGTADGRLLRPA
jgi:tellurite resistance protein TehA-like permease